MNDTFYYIERYFYYIERYFYYIERTFHFFLVAPRAILQARKFYLIVLIVLIGRGGRLTLPLAPFYIYCFCLL